MSEINDGGPAWAALDESIASIKAQHAAFVSAIAEFEHAVMTIIVNVRRTPACTPDELEKWWYDDKLPRIRAMLANTPAADAMLKAREVKP